MALNALKHGLLSRHVVLPNEDEQEFADFSLRLTNTLSPVGELEEVLVSTIAASAWRLRRLIRVERGLFVAYAADNARRKTPREHKEGVPLTVVLEFDEPGDIAEERAKFAQAERRAQAAEERAEKAERRLEEVDAMRATGDGEMGEAFMADADGIDAFSRLSRYEAHIQRSMFKALEELRRLQAARYSMHLAAPSELNP